MSRDDAPPPLAHHVTVVRLGHGANCSSIGSVVDTLFVTSLLGGAVFAAIVAALGEEKVEVIGPPAEPTPPAPRSESDEATP
jgi:hypothetical protein